jgi:penicillin-binding protein 2D
VIAVRNQRGAVIWFLLLLIVPLAAVAVLAALLFLTPLPRPEVPQASEVFDQNGILISRIFTEERREIPVSRMPQHLLDAIVAVEDDRFYRHRGIDPIAMARALYRNIRAGTIVEGGSTITQQLAKNLYTAHERTLGRKIREAILALKLEQLYTKREILAMYWNTVYLGEGTYGIEVAAQRYFGKSAADLTLAETALMAGLPRQPEYYAPTKDMNEAIRRRNFVLKTMTDKGYITAEAADAAREELIELAQAHPSAGNAPYFIDYVKVQLDRTHPDIAANIRRGGYRIYTTLDLKAQEAANEAVAALAPDAGAGKTDAVPQVALVALDPANGQIRAMVGGREMQQALLNRATVRRQPGSAFKPFVYGTALETRRYTVTSTFVDEPVSFPAGGGRVWSPENFRREYTRAPMGMRDALKQSKNAVTAQWMNTLKPRPVIDFARRMGIPPDARLTEDLTLGLGTSELSPLEMAVAFAPFANGGMRVQPTAILRITDGADNLIYSYRPPAPERAISDDLAYLMTDILKSVVRPGGTAGQVAGLIGGRPAAGKTGTTEESRDSWIVGYTRELVGAVWVGYDTPRETQYTGAITSAPIWAEFIRRAETGIPQHDWIQPPGVERVRICIATGMLANATCPAVEELFLRGTAPTQVDPNIYWDALLPRLPGIPLPLPPGEEAPQPPEPQPSPPRTLPGWPWPRPPMPLPPPRPGAPAPPAWWPFRAPVQDSDVEADSAE